MFEYRAGQCLVVTADLPVTGHCIDIADGAPSLAMALVLRPAVVADLVLRASTGRFARSGISRIRLQEARSLLVANTGDVAGIGHRVGYDSPSQFSEYRRLFGVPPGQDARLNLLARRVVPMG